MYSFSIGVPKALWNTWCPTRPSGHQLGQLDALKDNLHYHCCPTKVMGHQQFIDFPISGLESQKACGTQIVDHMLTHGHG